MQSRLCDVPERAPSRRCSFCFFNDTATTEIYTLSLHDALPISSRTPATMSSRTVTPPPRCWSSGVSAPAERSSHPSRSEEHTSELQSRQYLVCRLLLEKKKSRAGCCLPS